MMKQEEMLICLIMAKEQGKVKDKIARAHPYMEYGRTPSPGGPGPSGLHSAKASAWRMLRLKSIVFFPDLRIKQLFF